MDTLRSRCSSLIPPPLLLPLSLSSLIFSCITFTVLGGEVRGRPQGGPPSLANRLAAAPAPGQSPTPRPCLPAACLPACLPGMGACWWAVGAGRGVQVKQVCCCPAALAALAAAAVGACLHYRRSCNCGTGAPATLPPKEMALNPSTPATKLHCTYWDTPMCAVSPSTSPGQL